MRLAFATTILALTLAGCAGSTASDPGKDFAEIQRQERAVNADLIRAKPSADLRRPCGGPVGLRAAIRAGKASAGETERLWKQDRRELVDCGARKQAVQDFYDDRDARISGAASSPAKQ